MKLHLFSLATGAALATGLFLSCNGDSPGDADAQVDCNCPAAEAPLEGRIMRVEDTLLIPANSDGRSGVLCPTGAVLLSGGCSVDDGGTNLRVVETLPSNLPLQGWECRYRNFDAANPHTVRTYGLCLVPAE